MNIHVVYSSLQHNMTVDAQFISPSDPVCSGNCVIFTWQCQQPGTFIQWSIYLQPTQLRQTAQSTQVGSVITFGVDRGFDFELHIVSFSSNILTTELQVTAVRELNGVTVDCIGVSGTSMFTIQVASVGELIAAIRLWYIILF